jgi:hypothetical protein
MSILIVSCDRCHGANAVAPEPRAAASPETVHLRFIDSIGNLNQLLETAAMAEEGRWFILLFVEPAVFLFVYSPIADEAPG